MTKDLVVLVADVQQEKTVETILRERCQSLQIRQVTFDIFRHPRKDPGVFHEAADFLAPYVHPQYSYALVILDREWEGAPGDATHLRSTILGNLHRRGWDTHNCEVVVADPELEVWVWSTSSVVVEELRTTWDEVHSVARQKGHWQDGEAKPHRPKELLEEILRRNRRPLSAALFQSLARRVSLQSSSDSSFVLLRDTLSAWFPHR